LQIQARAAITVIKENERNNKIMIQAIKNKFLLIAAAAALAVTAFMLPAPAYAQVDINQGLDCGSNISLDRGNCDVSQGRSRVQDTIRTIINVFSVIVGAVAVIMIIFGGFRYITSGGDSNNIGSAKNTILYAIVGLVIVAIAQAIVQFVLTEV
jgi:hypothetical protein